MATTAAIATKVDFAGKGASEAGPTLADVVAAKNLSSAETRITALEKILSHSSMAEETTRAKEHALLALGEQFSELGDGQRLQTLVRTSREFLNSIPKARASKIVRDMVDLLGKIPNALDLQIQTTREVLLWAEEDRSAFFRQSLELRLAALLLEARQFSEATGLIDSLLTEVKRLDDKLLQAELLLLESRVYFELRNYAKSRASLTAARSSSNAVYCPPPLQAALDMHSGILHAQENDFKTAFSYFYEALEAYTGPKFSDNKQALRSLLYMLLSKIMMGAPEDISVVLGGKAALRIVDHADSRAPVEAMRVIAQAAGAASLSDLRAAREEQPHSAVLSVDPFLSMHLRNLQSDLLEKSLLRALLPYSRVELSRIAELVGVDETTIETKISQMILGKRFRGVLDQEAGCLEIFDPEDDDTLYVEARGVIENAGSAVDALFSRVAKLN
ncbi:hypothetical protein H696_03788 [Fonticula alba]|uniref:PCI domain-containing protein n=1 Tax=Fonticula alba TaxID=691883 RepID=A0A058Z5F0_FONAL|nr:hypothetical protein H696_03788 [Fonticula alba]KCV69356.1 hypothetical protein H696_03788 [Fonticula alba]|eukprot:XP_009495921.1 hypothetical protein H696_03788 [Fonticula alba]